MENCFVLVCIVYSSGKLWSHNVIGVYPEEGHAKHDCNRLQRMIDEVNLNCTSCSDNIRRSYQVQPATVYNTMRLPVVSNA